MKICVWFCISLLDVLNAHLIRICDNNVVTYKVFLKKCD